MKKFFDKILNKKIEIPEPDKYPNFNNIDQWMESKVAYYVNAYPDKIERLFDPSSGDYLPKDIIVGCSEVAFKEHIEYYREIKSRYPEAVEKVKSTFVDYAYYRGGAPEDYPL